MKTTEMCGRCCVCLVWKSGRSNRLLLLDCDASSHCSVDGWKRLNTLAHYNIPNNATFVLVNRRLAADPDSPVTRTVNGTNYSYNPFTFMLNRRAFLLLKSLYGQPISELRGVACHMGSHNATCHPTQVNTPCSNPSQ